MQKEVVSRFDTTPMCCYRLFRSLFLWSSLADTEKLIVVFPCIRGFSRHIATNSTSKKSDIATKRVSKLLYTWFLLLYT